MNKKLGWIITILLLIGAIYIGYRVLLPRFFPGFYFDHKMIAGQYTVYSDSTIESGISSTLKQVTERLEATELYQNQSPSGFRIYMCYEPALYGFFARKIGQNQVSQGVTIEPFGHVFVNPYGIKMVIRKYGGSDQYAYSLLEGSAEHIITHELIHVLITRRLGMFDSKNLPSWKREGYAEYGAALYEKQTDSTYSLSARLGSYLAGDYDEVPPGRRHYIKNGLIVEYLVEVKKVSFDSLMATEINPAEVFAELQRWQQNVKKEAGGGR